MAQEARDQNRQAAAAQPDFKARRSASLNYDRSRDRPARGAQANPWHAPAPVLEMEPLLARMPKMPHIYVPPITKYTNVTSSRRARERVI